MVKYFIRNKERGFNMESLKKLRKLYGFKQSDVAKSANITQSTYSNYENGLRNIPHNDLKNILNFYNLTFRDFEQFEINTAEFNKINTLYYKSVFDLDSEKVKQIYDYFAERKDESFYFYSYYLRVFRFFHDDFPKIVPDLTKNEIDDLINRLKNTKYPSYLHFLLFTNLAHYLDYDEVLEITDYLLQFVNFSTSDYQIKDEAISILNNAVDISIKRKMFDNASIYLEKLEMALQEYPYLNYIIFLDYYKVLVGSKLKLTKIHKKKIDKIINSLHTLNLTMLAETMQREYDSLKNGTYLDIQDTTFLIH